MLLLPPIQKAEWRPRNAQRSLPTTPEMHGMDILSVSTFDVPPSDAEDDDCSIYEAKVEAGVVDALISLGDGGTVELQEEMVGEEDEYGWAPEQAEA